MDIVKKLIFTPFGLVDVPHKLREDDVYDGYHLEKDSTVIVNNW